MKEDTILITAGTGNIGTELTALLASTPKVKEIRVATRDPKSEKAQLLHALNPKLVKPVSFDFRNSKSLKEAFEGVNKLALIVPLGDEMVAYQEAVISQAKAHGLEFIVKGSVDSAKPNAAFAPAAAHWHGEELIRKTGIPTVMIRPTIYMQHFMIVPGLYERGDNEFYLPSGDGKIAFLDCRDISYAMYRLIQNPEKVGILENDFFFLTGPQALSGHEMAEQLSNATGKKFKWNKSEKDFEAHSEKTGSPVIVKEVYKAGAAGYLANVAIDHFERITGKQPNSFARFIMDHRYYFM